MRLGAHPEMQLFFCTCEVLQPRNTFVVGEECLAGGTPEWPEKKCPNAQGPTTKEVFPSQTSVVAKKPCIL